MAEREVGIIITVKDLASATMKRIAQATGWLSKEWTATKTVGTETMKSIGSAIRTVDHALNLAARMFRVFKAAIGETVNKALEFRQAGDPMLQWFKDAQREADLVRARMGDILLPIIKGFATALGGVGTSMSKWLETNRKLIASGIVEWVGKLGNLLISVVARGVLYVTKAWMGVGAAVQLVMLGIARFVEHSIAGAGDIVWAFREVAKAIGADGVAAGLDKALMSVRGLESGIGAFADGAQTELELTSAEIVAMDQELRSVEKTAKDLLAKGVVSAQREIARSVAGTTRTIEEQGKALEALAARTARLQAAGVRGMAAAAKEARALWDFQADAAEKQGRALDEEMDRQAQKADEAAQNAFAVGNAIGSVIGEAIAAQKSLGETTKAVGRATMLSVIEIMQRIIMAEAAAAAAAAFRTHAGLGPFVGIVLGAAAASTAFAAVSALVNKMADGGVIRGGQPGRDSVPALLMPGERVLTVRENSAFETLMGSLSKHGTAAGGGPVRMANGGVVRGGNGMGSITIAPQLQLLDAPSSPQQRKRLLLNLAQEIEDLVANGAMLRSLQQGTA